MTLQGYLASGDTDTRKYDETIINIPRKTNCVDDTVLWDEELSNYWWRMIDYLEKRFLNWGKFTSGGKFPCFRG